jgi:hypothetical protein
MLKRTDSLIVYKQRINFRNIILMNANLCGGNWTNRFYPPPLLTPLWMDSSSLKWKIIPAIFLFREKKEYNIVLDILYFMYISCLVCPLNNFKNRKRKDTIHCNCSISAIYYFIFCLHISSEDLLHFILSVYSSWILSFTSSKHRLTVGPCFSCIQNFILQIIFHIPK